MRARIIPPICVIALLACAGWTSDPKSDSDAAVSQTLQAIEQTWANAEKNHDATSFEKLVADNWIAITPDGKRQTKAERSAKIKNSHMDSASLGDMNVRVFGDTAIVTGTAEETADNSTHHYVWTDVFIKRRGQWLAVASQTALVKYTV